MIRIVIDGVVYSVKEFKRDMVRMFNSLREADSCNWGSACCDDIACYKCPLDDICRECPDASPILLSYEAVEAVHCWAKKHPFVTNEDKLRETFGNDAADMINSAVNCSSCKAPFNEWLTQEYRKSKDI